MKRRRPAVALVRDVFIVVAVSLLTFQALRRFVGDYYRVPSRSMEPLLHGDSATGDIVYVDAWSSAGDVQRHDLVVVRHPHDANAQLVKRLVATGDDPKARCIELRGGDLWYGPDPQRLQREVKDPLAARVMRVEWASWPGGDEVGGLDVSAAAVEDGRLVLPPLTFDREGLRRLCRDRRRNGMSAMPAEVLKTARSVDATYIDATGRRGREGEDVSVYDCGMDLVVMGSATSIVAVLDTRRETFTFVWQPATGRLELWRDGEDVEHTTLPAVVGRHRIEFGHLDDRLFFVIDGKAEALFCVPRRAAWNRPAQGLPRGPRSRLFVAALGSSPLEVESLTVFRDVYYFRDRIIGVPGQPNVWPIRLDPGEWFLLGDNAFDSRDSRHFRAVPSSSYLGRPWFVLGPWPRQRWLVQ